MKLYLMSSIIVGSLALVACGEGFKAELAKTTSKVELKKTDLDIANVDKNPEEQMEESANKAEVSTDQFEEMDENQESVTDAVVEEVTEYVADASVTQPVLSAPINMNEVPELKLDEVKAEEEVVRVSLINKEEAAKPAAQVKGIKSNQRKKPNVSAVYTSGHFKAKVKILDAGKGVVKCEGKGEQLKILTQVKNAASSTLLIQIPKVTEIPSKFTAIGKDATMSIAYVLGKETGQWIPDQSKKHCQVEISTEDKVTLKVRVECLMKDRQGKIKNNLALGAAVRCRVAELKAP